VAGLDGVARSMRADTASIAAAFSPLCARGQKKLPESSMEEIAASIGNYVGISGPTARLAIGHVFAFLEKRNPAVGVELISRVPGAREAVDAALAAPRRGFLGVALGGLGALVAKDQKDIVDLTSRLTSMGLSAAQLQKLAKAVFLLAEQAIGRQKLQPVTDTIPGLSKFLWPNG
jgi:hypothetical protein